MKQVGVGTIAVVMLSLVACEEKPQQTGQANPGQKEQKQSASGNQKEDGSATKGELYEDSIRDQACEILTKDTVARIFEIPATELEQREIMGCLYEWEQDDQELQVRLGSMRVHDTVAQADQWFDNATKGLSQKETAEAMGKIKQRMEERGELDNKLKEKATDEIGGAIGHMAGPKGFQFEDVAGVGDEARVSLNDGELWVRTKNLMFIVSAYKGEAMPEPDLSGVGIKDMAKVAIDANKAWTKKTLEQRKQQAKKVADAVLKSLP